MNGERWQVLTGDCLDLLRGLPDGSIDAVVTDPPYGLSFMGKKWDTSVPGTEVWEQALRVLKPGAHLLCFFGTRTYHRGVVAIEDAGFEIRDQLAWMYGSGFPKSHNLSGEWEGWGSALKPAWEPVVLARKPLEGTIAQNVEEHGTGALNIDGCRVGTEARVLPAKDGAEAFAAKYGRDSSGSHKWNGCEAKETTGRWPANVCHDGSEEVEAAFAQFGESQSSGRERFAARSIGGDGTYNGGGAITTTGHSDSGTASRFFFCGKATKADRDEGLEDFTVTPPGASAGGRQEGSAGITAYAGTRGPAHNPHPTVKPTALMRWLCRLITPPGGLVLDPFTGSGSTGKAALIEGFRFLGCELDPAYADIARARIATAAAQPRLDFDAPDQSPKPKYTTGELFG